MNISDKIFIAGANGMVGSAIKRKLIEKGYKNILCPPSSELDLTKQKDVNLWFNEFKPDYVFLAAAKVGGVLANKNYPAEFIYENLMIQSNVIHAAYKNQAKKLLFLGSSCIYPKMSEQPIKEEYLMSGKLEETNEAYAIAKIAGIEMCKMYKRQYNFNCISVMPPNLYGPHDNFNDGTSHVIPAMIKNFLSAVKEKNDEVVLYGDGSPIREFMYVDDLADACLFLMDNYNEEEQINVGSSQYFSISNLARIIAEKTKYEGQIIWDPSKPNGTAIRILDNSKINQLGWKFIVQLEEGLEKTINWYKENILKQER